MADKIQDIATGIYANVGGKENVSKVVHCMTRVRMGIKDYSKVNMDGLKAVNGVMGVVEDDTLQVVIGPGTVNKVAQAMVDMVGVKLGDDFPEVTQEEADGTLSSQELAEKKANEKKAEIKKKNQKPWSKALKSISNIFVPLIPAFVGSGMIGGIASIFQNMYEAGDVTGGNWLLAIGILNIIKNGIFSYLVIYVGINSASEFGATPSLGGVMGGITFLVHGLSPDKFGEVVIPNIFSGEALKPGQGGVIGVILSVWLLSYVEK